jgi:hypothetical protein
MSLTDCQLIITTTDGNKIKTLINASRFVLSNNSQYFKGLFENSTMKLPSLSFTEEEDMIQYIVTLIHLPFNHQIKYAPHPDILINMLLVAQKYLFQEVSIYLRKFLVNNHIDLISLIDDDMILLTLFDQFTLSELNTVINKIEEVTPCLTKYFFAHANKSGYVPQNLIRLYNRIPIMKDYISMLTVKCSLRSEFGSESVIYPSNVTKIKYDIDIDYYRFDIGNIKDFNYNKCYLVRISDLRAVDYHHFICYLRPLNCLKSGYKIEDIIRADYFYEAYDNNVYPVEILGNSHPRINEWNGSDQECLLINNLNISNFEEKFDHLKILLKERKSSK